MGWVEAEVADFLAKHADLKTEGGHNRIVHPGHLPEREVITAIGPVGLWFQRLASTRQRKF